MADPLGSLKKIVKLALRIKEAVDTVRQNKEECQQIRTRAVRVSSLLARLPETGMTADPAMCDALEDLEDSLRRAHALVAACQESTTVCLYCTARKQARRLRRVQDDISQKVMLVVFATNIQTTIILTSIWTGDAAPVAQAAGEMIEMPVADPCNLPANGDSNVAPATSGMTSGSGCWLPPTPRDGAVTPIRKWLARASINPSAGQRKPWYLRPPRDLSAQDLLLLSPPQSGLRKFSLSELEAAAHHFSVENMVGSGSFATVYKGILPDGLVVAIKEFRNPYVLSAQEIDELHLVSINVKHENIAKLIGYGSSEVLERAEQFEDAKLRAKEDKETSYYFVEEYMPNGSLDKIIYGLQLDWSSRFHLIQGIAQGLRYLHKRNVVHLDVKPSNILLNCDMNPKITDFGIARVLNHKGVDIRSGIGTVAGTLGYMPPEYIMDGTLSKKNDVYGFGVTILEVISSMSRFKRASGQASIEWAWEAQQAGSGMMELLDPSLFDAPQLKEIERCVEIGLLCTQFDQADRPDMVEALEMLRGDKEPRTPVRPGYTKDREPSSCLKGCGCRRVRL
ncbi:G-type lectin S-receptor-like serine/threonine-protein kinase At1g61480 isoform X2 [Panicum virgatum]|nr:G-type lectin S-receptor-like serine/threonine-protein kinase At1g61480 isoform X2 [Panicum virgatum]KAG2583713.1 hypothetical protein PVAP13_6KG192930 [Panicum virgatum]